MFCEDFNNGMDGMCSLVVRVSHGSRDGLFMAFEFFDGLIEGVVAGQKSGDISSPTGIRIFTLERLNRM